MFDSPGRPPAALWLAATTLFFVDRRLIVLVATVFLVGIAAAFLLGTVRDPVKEKIRGGPGARRGSAHRPQRAGTCVG